MAKHTPGKWIIEEVSGFNEIFSESGDPVCRLAVFSETVTGTPKQDESDANARLIAHAPAMLEMLQTIVEDMEQYDGATISIKDIKGLIKSATTV